MNNRILDLAIKSGHIVGELPLNANEKIQFAGLERFAELIIQECADQLYYTREEMIDETICQAIKKRIENHFGVEE